MQTTRYPLTSVALVAAIIALAAHSARAADRPGNAADQERQLIGVLQSDAPKADKAITCKRLVIHGTAAAVPPLAALLDDAELASWARIALEAIPGPEADGALREALGRLQGRLLVGAINSIGVRRDQRAVESLAGRLGDADPEVASAAAAALGRIGNDAAAKILQKSLGAAPAAVRSAVAEGCILCAERALAGGNAARAVELYDLVRESAAPKQRIVEATRGAILARRSAGVPLLVEQLKSADKGMFNIGLTTARELPGREVTEGLAAAVAGAVPARQGLLVGALADRRDEAVLPAVLAIAKNGSETARQAAVAALQRVGDASCVPVLMEMAAGADAELAKAAAEALAGLPGKDVDADLAERLPQASGAARRVLIELAGRRRIAAASGALIEAADDADGKIRALALAALGSTIGPDELSFLITRAVAPPHAADAKAAMPALKAACIRMPDGQTCATMLIAAMSDAPIATKSSILEILGAMGNATALEAVGAAARDKSTELQDTASRLLGEWMSVDAAPVLLELAKTATDSKYQVRALRGYIRLVRQFTLPDAQRVEMCRAALAAASRKDEQELVLEVIGRYPSVDMLRLAVEAAKDPALKDAATAVSLSIAQKIGGSVDVQDLLAKIGHEPMKIEIIKAEYGAGTTFKDVTAILRKYVRDFPLIVMPTGSYNSAFGGDPLPNVVKTLEVRYRIDGREGEASFGENATIMLPVPK
ncbi:MAG: PBS lyase [Pirellulaceae bacterium]|jgi:HEAT repeat protein|nr:HEAT repeat domain-containing protein [Thermoguttaceae bacterium]NLZ00168.1 PBS lyase [Pirellulaceae bacterium]